jgi:hypoxanthine-DNA glycosylase
MPAAHARCFAPVIGPGARVLILGSMPGARSLAAQEYYAHPQNQFWPLVEALLGVPRTTPYAQRLAALRRHRIALWDVLESCDRTGSLDSAIDPRSAIPNDLPRLLRAQPDIQLICCNGSTAYHCLRRHFARALREEFPHVECVRLPSTSPAHASLRAAQKFAVWRAALSSAGQRQVTSDAPAPNIT